MEESELLKTKNVEIISNIFIFTDNDTGRGVEVITE